MMGRLEGYRRTCQTTKTARNREVCLVMTSLKAFRTLAFTGEDVREIDQERNETTNIECECAFVTRRLCQALMPQTAPYGGSFQEQESLIREADSECMYYIPVQEGTPKDLDSVNL
jgi:hypothetical protein